MQGHLPARPGKPNPVNGVEEKSMVGKRVPSGQARGLCVAAALLRSGGGEWLRLKEFNYEKRETNEKRGPEK
jgi:hypothetical protein